MTLVTIMGKKSDLIRMLQPLPVLNDECKLIFTNSGMVSKLVDPAHVSMVQVDVDKSYFTEYKISDQLKVNGSVEIGIDLDDFLTTLSVQSIDPSDEVKVVFDTDGGDENKITMNGEHLRLHKPFRPIDTTGMSDPKIPNLTLSFTFELLSQKKLRQIVNDIGKFSDHLRIIHKPDEPNKLFIEWPDQHDSKGYFELTDKLARTLECTEKNDTIRATFPVDYFQSILRGLARTCFGDVKLTCLTGHDYPIKIIAGKKPLEVMYLLAPRIESD